MIVALAMRSLSCMFRMWLSIVSQESSRCVMVVSTVHGMPVLAAPSTLLWACLCAQCWLMFFFVVPIVTPQVPHTNALRGLSKVAGDGSCPVSLAWANMLAQIHPYVFFSLSKVECFDLMCEEREDAHVVTYSQLGHGQK